MLRSAAIGFKILTAGAARLVPNRLDEMEDFMGPKIGNARKAANMNDVLTKNIIRCGIGPRARLTAPNTVSLNFLLIRFVKGMVAMAKPI